MSRSQKVGQQLKREISQIFHDEIKDPRLGFITVTHAQVSGDLRYAKIYYSVLGSAKEQKESAKAISSAKGFIRGIISHRLKMRFAPEITFIFDKSSEYSLQIQQAIDRLKEGRNEN